MMFSPRGDRDHLGECMEVGVQRSYVLIICTLSVAIMGGEGLTLQPTSAGWPGWSLLTSAKRCAGLGHPQ